MRHVKWVFILISLSVIGISTSAQDLCGAIVRSAMETTQASCDELETDTVCFGHLNLEAIFRDTVDDDLIFEQPADIVAWQDVDVLRSLGIDFEADEWGVTVFRLETTTSDEPLRVFMLGDTALQNTNEPDAETFSFNFGTSGQSECADAPNTVLVQGAPDESVQFEINGIPMQLRSTIALGTSQDDDGENFVWIATLAGDADAGWQTSWGETVSQGQIVRAYPNDDETWRLTEPTDIGDYDDIGWQRFMFTQVMDEILLYYPIELPSSVPVQFDDGWTPSDDN